MVVGVTLRSDYRSWGGTVTALHHVVKPSCPEQVVQLLRNRELAVLAYGCGRSYGDVAINPDGALVDCRKLDRFIAFDPSTGILICEGGVQLADILATVCRPEPDGGGWFLPVSPGTRFVTVAGAIANDVHGKNHHCAGTFGRHLVSFDLARSDGSVLVCSRSENKGLFSATIGGLGLTGIILRVALQLRRVEGLAVGRNREYPLPFTRRIL
jgi:FAD/FMN-containing dehydrogenase